LRARRYMSVEREQSPNREGLKAAEAFFDRVQSLTHRGNRECWNILVAFLADCLRIHPLEEQYHKISQHLIEPAKAYIEAFYQEPWDWLGEVFEKHGCGNEKLGQFLTPRYIVQMMNQMTIGKIPDDKQEWTTVLDPCTGTGRFLTEASLMYPQKKLALFGIEIDLDLYRAALVNTKMVALRTGHPYFILCADALVVDCRMGSPNWRLANSWNPPDWQENMAMECGVTWSQFQKMTESQRNLLLAKARLDREGKPQGEAITMRTEAAPSGQMKMLLE